MASRKQTRKAAQRSTGTASERNPSAEVTVEAWGGSADGEITVVNAGGGGGAAPNPAPEPSPASRARRRAGLVAELKSQDITPERAIEVRAELAAMLGVPILSPEELRRLGP